MDYVEEEIKELCKFFKARAYINLAPKSIKKTAALELKYLAQRIYEGDYKKIWKAWNTCAGEINGVEPRWIIDIDGVNDSTRLDEVWGFINSYEPVGDKYVAEIPTLSGWHMITTPFNI